MEILSAVNSAKIPDRFRESQNIIASMSRREIHDYLRDILSQSTSLESISKRSSLHANGFSKIVLERRLGFALRLHIWEPSDNSQGKGGKAPENIHDHVWSFGSRILIGGLGEHRFIESSRGVEMDHYRYERSRATLPPGNLSFQGNSRLAISDDLLHREGNFYHVSNTILHRAWNIKDSGYAATMVLTGSPRSQGASVYTQTGTHVREDIDKANISPRNTERLIRMVTEALQ